MNKSYWVARHRQESDLFIIDNDGYLSKYEDDNETASRCLNMQAVCDTFEAVEILLEEFNMSGLSFEIPFGNNEAVMDAIDRIRENFQKSAFSRD